MEQEIKEKIINQAKRIEEDCLYSSKSHYNTAAFWSAFYLWIGIIITILSAFVGAVVNVKSALPPDYEVVLVTITGVVSIFIPILVAVTTFIKPNEKALQHHNAGNKYNALKSKVKIFYEITINIKTNNEEILEELNYLNESRSELNKTTPHPLDFAYKKAQKGIREGEANYKVDI